MRMNPLRAAFGSILSLFLLSAAAQTSKPPAPVDAAATWMKECSSCHMAYPPGLLPERSWRKTMGGLEKHFGENAGLDAAATGAILEYLAQNSAERNTNRRSSRFLAGIPASETPERITENAYFTSKHRKVAAGDWKLPKVRSPANCDACHADAAQGNFSDRGVKIPR